MAPAALDELMKVLERLEQPVSRGDEIDRVLAGPPRRTDVTPLRDSPVMERFRTELADGLVRLDTLNQFLRLVATVLDRLPL
jgi:hypothetical protein